MTHHCGSRTHRADDGTGFPNNVGKNGSRNVHLIPPLLPTPRSATVHECAFALRHVSFEAQMGSPRPYSMLPRLSESDGDYGRRLEKLNSMRRLRGNILGSPTWKTPSLCRSRIGGNPAPISAVHRYQKGTVGGFTVMHRSETCGHAHETIANAERCKFRGPALESATTAPASSYLSLT